MFLLAYKNGVANVCSPHFQSIFLRLEAPKGRCLSQDLLRFALWNCAPGHGAS